MSEAPIHRSDALRPPPAAIDFRAILYAMREKALLIAGCTLVGLAVGVIYLLVAPKQYIAECLVQVQEAPRKVVKFEESETTAGALETFESLKTLERSLASRPVLERVVRSPALKLTPATLGLPARKLPYTERDLAETLGYKTEVTLLRGTKLLSVAVQNPDPALAADLANAMVQEYKRQFAAQRLESSDDAHEFLLGEAHRLKLALEASERSAHAYKEQSNAVSLEEGQNIVVAGLKELDGKLTEAKATRLKLEAAAAQANRQDLTDPETLLIISEVADDPEVASQRKLVADLEATVASLNERYLAKHPKLIQAKSQLAELKAGLNRAILSAAHGLEERLAAAVDAERRLQAAVSEQEHKAMDLNKMSIDYSMLSRDVESDRALYNSVMTRLKELDVTRGLDQGAIQIVESAVPPNHPARPRRTLTLGISLVGGLFVGLLWSLLRAAFDTSLKTVDEAETEMGMPVLAAIPKSRNALDAAGLLVVESDPGSLQSEAFRTLRTALLLPAREAQTILFTSPGAGDGKTFCCLNCAAAFAQLGSRTLLIDADLRLPALERILFKEGMRPGLSDVLTNRSSLDDAVAATDVDNLFVLTAGRTVNNPAELLTGPGIDALLRQAQEKFDRIIIDTAPVQAVSDALLLVSHVGAVCVVVSAGLTPRKAVAKACQRLHEAGAGRASMVLNRLPTNGQNYYHYGAGMYGPGNYTREQQANGFAIEAPVEVAHVNGKGGNGHVG
jgi:capsular exopolysaccharide synthesis family protein